MSTLARALSHPILQGIGAVAAVLALIFPAFLALGPRSPDGVSVIYAETVHLSKMIPMFKIVSSTENGAKIVANVDIAFFFIRNDTKNAIRPSDFIEPLGIGLKDNARVIDVQSCDRTYTYLAVDHKPVRIAWKKEPTLWIAEPVLLNPKESSCVAISYEVPDGSPETKVFAVVSGRIANAQITTYTTLREYQDKYAKDLSYGLDLLQIDVHITGIAVWYFFFSQILLFSLTVSLTYRAQLMETSKKAIFLCLVAMLLSTATAECATHLVFRKNAIVPIGWFLIILHGTILLLLLVRAIRLHHRHALVTPSQRPTRRSRKSRG